VGTNTNDFGTLGAAQHCLFLDTRKQAERFHQQLLNHYLRAHAGDVASEKISVAIVGAGATGVELAAELHHAAHELAAYGLDRIQPKDMHITLIEAGPRAAGAAGAHQRAGAQDPGKTRGEGDDQRRGQ
jgi:NADH dehydrogenase